MERTWVGLGFGAACGLTIGVGVVIGFVGWDRFDSENVAIVGTLMAGAGAATGAVVGGVADILKFLRCATGAGNRTAHEADYRETDRPSA